MSQPPNTMSFNSASGTNSRMPGDQLSVRLPRRIVPICVSEPIGLANPLRIAITPAIVVVLTAPRPTSRTPSLPRAGAISTGVAMKLKLYQLARRSGAKAGYDTADVSETRRPVSPGRRHDRREDGGSPAA